MSFTNVFVYNCKEVFTAHTVINFFLASFVPYCFYG